MRSRDVRLTKARRRSPATSRRGEVRTQSIDWASDFTYVAARGRASSTWSTGHPHRCPPTRWSDPRGRLQLRTEAHRSHQRLSRPPYERATARATVASQLPPDLARHIPARCRYTRRGSRRHAGIAVVVRSVACDLRTTTGLVPEVQSIGSVSSTDGAFDVEQARRRRDRSRSNSNHHRGRRSTPPAQYADALRISFMASAHATSRIQRLRRWYEERSAVVRLRVARYSRIRPAGGVIDKPGVQIRDLLVVSDEVVVHT